MPPIGRSSRISLGSPGFPSHIGPHVISDKQPSVIMDSCTYGVCEGEPGYYKEKVELDERISDDGEFVHSAPWSVVRDVTFHDNIVRGAAVGWKAQGLDDGHRTAQAARVRPAPRDWPQ